jgi:hypothetical protein
MYRDEFTRANNLHRWEDSIETGAKEIEWNWLGLYLSGLSEDGNQNSGSINSGHFMNNGGKLAF